MTSDRLSTHPEVNALIGSVFSAPASPLDSLFEGGVSLDLAVRDDVAFGQSKWLELGKVSIHASGVASDENSAQPLSRAALMGSFEWAIPTLTSVTDQLEALTTLDSAAPAAGGRRASDPAVTRHKLEEVAKWIACSAVRSGLIHPVFDAGLIEDLPFIAPTTIVCDTSAVAHGALNFAARFLPPHARFRVPAIVSMELIAQTDNYLSARRGGALTQLQRIGALGHHAISQAGLRCLTRLALQPDVEVDRPRLGADPLRGIAEQSPDTEDKLLGIHQLVKSFADRLILETAIQQREKQTSDCKIGLLTSDQGLARAALAEGVQPFFFDSAASKKAFGTTVLGTCFAPLVDPQSDARLYAVPLTEVLWELAVSFGSVRLQQSTPTKSLEVTAIGHSLSWQPFHSRNDLMWVRTEGSTEAGAAPRGKRGLARAQTILDLPSAKVKAAPRVPPSSSRGLLGSYRFSPSAMVMLIDTMADRNRLEDSEAMQLLGIANYQGYLDYRNFLISGEMAAAQGNGLAPLAALRNLRIAIRQQDFDAAEALFRQVPSFARFLSELKTGSPTDPGSLKLVRPAAVSSYLPLADAAACVLFVPGEGIYATPLKPDARRFAAMGLAAFNDLRKGEELVRTGQWLEELGRAGLHPLRTRSLLEQSWRDKLLVRSFEGSTPETRFKGHNVHAFSTVQGRARLEELSLYDGLFLMPGRASVSLRLGKVET
ncbi:MAG: hypothetical protein L3K23_06580 [Thermoplasmata archaeon]|nr:hypothetical protein [Thermoplasmata archaeon]